MKKFILPILLFLMFIPVVANAETCDTEKITISSITLEDKSDNVEELVEATANGKNINLNLSMSEVGDSIEFKFIVKNDSNEDYELDKTSLNLNSDYINYSFETEDNSNIVKAKSSKNVSLRVEYKTEVPEDKFESGTYTDSKTMTVQLYNGETINVPDTFKNPNTGVQSYILILIIILLISGSLYILLKKKKYAKFLILIIATAIIIPISVYALCKCEITINSTVVINKNYKVSYVIEDLYGSIWIKEGELINYDLSRANCVDGYIGEQRLSNKYKVCSGTLIYNEMNLLSGQNILLKPLKLRYFDMTNNCEEITEDGYVCEKETPEHYEEWEYMIYSKSNSEKYNYSNFFEDKEIMNFVNIEFDRWNDNGSMGIKAPQSFIMPSHDVIFWVFSD